MWRTVDNLLNKTKSSSIPRFSPDDYYDFIDSKIAGSNSDCNGISADGYTCITPDLATFKTVSVDEIIRAISMSPSKHCPSDPLSTWLLKGCAATVAPFITRIVNLLLHGGDFPSPWKHVIVIPFLQKAGLDDSVVSSYRLVSNLPHLSESWQDCPSPGDQLSWRIQAVARFSAYHRGHSTEMAVLKVYLDLIDTIWNGKYALLSLLDLTAAFDMVDQNILLHHLETTFDFHGMPLQWMWSYLDGRTQPILLGDKSTSPRPTVYSVPQGSVMRSLPFTLYTTNISKVIQQNGPSHHSYADNNQLYLSCNQHECAALNSRMIKCIESIDEWMSCNRLMLNPSKSVFMWCASQRWTHLVDRSAFVLPDGLVNMWLSLRNLLAYFGKSMSMTEYVNCLMRLCFNQLRWIRFIRHSLTTTVATGLVNSFVTARVDYCNSILIGYQSTNSSISSHFST